MLPPPRAAACLVVAAAALAACTAAAAAAPAFTAAAGARAQWLAARRLPFVAASRRRRVVGGSEADVSAAPWTAALQHRRHHLCGASIIAARWLLTSAHCARNAPAQLSARVGSSLRGSGGQVLQAQAVTSHERYQPWSWDYDIAVIQLDGDIAFDKNKKAVSLARQEPARGSEALLSGWGLQGRDGAASARLRTATLRIYDRDPCNAKYNAALTPRLLCAGSKGVDACVGDAGGPLVLVAAGSGQQVGVVLWEHDCARPRHLETDFRMPYTSVAALHAWVRDKTGI